MVYALKMAYWYIYAIFTDIENTPMDMGWGEEGEGELYGETKMEIDNTTCKADSPW